MLNARLTPYRQSFRCPTCCAPFEDCDAGFRCIVCGSIFAELNGVLSLCASETLSSAVQFEKDDAENGLKNWFKRWPRFYETVTHIITPVLFSGLTMKRFLARFPAGNGLHILNVGAGPFRLHPDEIGIDLYPFKAVDILADATHLPFANSTFDIVGSEQVLEHVPDPRRMIDELIRITKPGGLIYLGIPYMYPYHPSPKDYTRWSFDGLVEMVKPCIEVEKGIMSGPTSGMLSILGIWLSILFSFGYAPLQRLLSYVFFIVLSPLKLFDYLLTRFPGAQGISCAIYIVVRVPEKIT